VPDLQVPPIELPKLLPQGHLKDVVCLQKTDRETQSVEELSAL